MSTFASNIKAAMEAIETGLRDDREKWDDKQSKAGTAVPWPGRSPANPKDIKWAAKLMKDIELPHYFSHADLKDAEMNAIDRHIADMRSLPEFEPIKTRVIDIHWTSKPLLVNDKFNPGVVFARVKVVGKEERQTWPVAEDAPDYRMTISFPFWALCELEANHDLLDRQIHASLCLMGGGDTNKIRRPDIVGFAATLGRFGTVGATETRAVANAMKNQTTLGHIDTYTTQGWFFDPIDPRQTTMFPPEKESKPAAEATESAPRGRKKKHSQTPAEA